MVKQATKGQKEIYEENQLTIRYYFLASVVSIAIYFGGCQFMWECSTNAWIFFALTVLMQACAVFFMKSMAGSRFDERGHVVDAGMDLNDPTAFGEYCKDAVILAVIIQLICLYTNYGYLLLLSIPGILGYKFLFSFLIPWLTAPSAGDEEMDEKKLRKKERREKIMYRR